MNAEEFLIGINEIEDILEEEQADEETYSRLDMTVLTMASILGYSISSNELAIYDKELL